MTLAATLTRAAAASAAVAFSAGAVWAEEPGPIFAPVVIGVPAHLELGVGVLGWGGSTYGLLEGAGRITIPHASGWKLEIEATGSAAFWGGGYSDSIFAGYGHFYRSTPNGQAGFFGGLLSNYGAAGVLGIEGRWAFGPTTVALGQLTGLFYNGGTTGLQLRGELWHYVTPDHKWGVFADVLDFDCCSASWQLGLAGEKRLMGSPMSVYGRLAAASFYGTSGWVGMVGARFFTSGPTLRQADDDVPFAVRLNPAVFD